MSQEDNTAKGYIIKSFFNTSMFVIIGILTKVVTLIFNMLIARNITKESYGIAKVYLEFIFILILYFPRETIRKTVQKYCPEKNEVDENKKFVDSTQLCWILNFIFNLLSVPIFFVFLYFAENLNNVKIHLILYLLSANIEMMVEPIMLYSNIKIENKYKLIAITLTNYTRVISNYLFIVIFGFDLWSFTLSRLLSSSLYSVYLLYIGIIKFKLGTSILPNFFKIKSLFEEKPELKNIFYSFTRTNVLKMILTYTEKTILSFFLSFSEAEKAEYSFITDNFAIIIRHVLEPIEENFFNVINKLKSLSDETLTNKNNAFNMLKIYIKVMNIFGLLLIGYIFVIGKEAIIFIFTEKWASDSSIRILKSYSIYVSIISINGILEAYANATFNIDKLNKYNSLMILNTFILIFLSVILSKYDIVGLIYANGINMILRIIINLYMSVDQIFNFIKNCALNGFTLVITLVGLLILNSIKPIIQKNYLIVFTGGIIFVVNCGLIYLIEKKSASRILKEKN